jgi:hypothetical protein
VSAYVPGTLTGPPLEMLGYQPVYCTLNREGEWTPMTGTTGGAPFPALGGVQFTVPDEPFRPALRPPPDVLIMDVDDHDGQGTGPATIEKMSEALGDLPLTWGLTARGPDCAAARYLYRIPPDLIVSNRPFLAYGGSVDARRTGWSFSWAPGDIHPGLGTPVRCYGPDGQECDLPPVGAVPMLPDAWIAYFREFPERAAAEAGPVDAGDVPDPLPVAVLDEVQRDEADRPLNSEGTGPALHTAVYRLVHVCFDAGLSQEETTAVAVKLSPYADELAQQRHTTAAVEVARCWGEIEARAPDEPQWLTQGQAPTMFELSAACARDYAVAARRGLIASMNGHAPALNDAAPLYVLNPDGTPTGQVIHPSANRHVPVQQQAPVATAEPVMLTVNLPDEFWAALPALGHIRAAAWHRCGSADAVLHATLARVAAMWPPYLRLDTGIAPASANYFTCLCGLSGTGKTIAADVAGDLLPKLVRPWGGQDVTAMAYPGDPVPQPGWDTFADNMPLGSGEGLAELYFTTRLEEPPGGKGKPRTVKAKTRNHAFVFADEGEKMAKMLERSGATIGEALRSAWMGALIGQANASVETTRVVPKGSYALGMVIGFQPSTIGPLLADGASGTPQRFTYAAAADPSIPELPPAWPGELAIAWPPGLSLLGSLFPFAPAVQAEVRAARLARARGREEPEPYSEHGMLTRCKMAALLAVLAGAQQVDGYLWELSAVLWETSCAVRGLMLAYGAQQAAAAEWHVRQTMAGRQVEVEGATDAARHGRTLAKAARSAGRHVHKAACAGGCTRSCVMRTMASGYRKEVTVDEVIAVLLEAGVIEAHGDGYKPGPESPG